MMLIRCSQRYGKAFLFSLLLALIPAFAFNAPAAADQTTSADANYLNTISFDSDYSVISNLKQNWNLATLAYGRQFNFGSVTGYISKANRFSENGYQYGIYAYPHLFKGAYLYLNYARSGSPLFPENRYDSEIFFSLPHAYEFSVGERYMQFSSITRIYTGSIGKYIGNYWISYRPYITPGKVGTSVSHTLTVRRYFESAEHYISFYTSVGSSPMNLDQIDPASIDAFHTTTFKVSGLNPLSKRLALGWGVAYSRQAFPRSTMRYVWDFSAGLAYKF